MITGSDLLLILLVSLVLCIGFALLCRPTSPRSSALAIGFRLAAVTIGINAFVGLFLRGWELTERSGSSFPRRPDGLLDEYLKVLVYHRPLFFLVFSLLALALSVSIYSVLRDRKNHPWVKEKRKKSKNRMNRLVPTENKYE